MPIRCSSTPSSGALPVRSPLPRQVPLIAPQPSRTAARQLATISQVSLWGWNSRSSGGSPSARSLRKMQRDAARQRDVVVGQPEPHRVADAELRADARAVRRAVSMTASTNGSKKSIGARVASSRCKPRTDAGVQRHAASRPGRSAPPERARRA